MPAFTAEHDALRDTVRRVVEARLGAMAAEAETGATPHPAALAELDAVGVVGLDDPRAALVVAEELGRLPSAGLAMALIDAAAVPGADGAPIGVARGQRVAVTGETASGSLPFVTAGAVAQRCVIAEQGVVTDLAGAVVEVPDEPHGLRGAAPAMVTLQQAGCRPVALQGWGLVELLQAAAAVSGGWRTWEQTRDYALQREAFGRPVAHFQVNRHALAAAATRLTAAQALVRDTVRSWRPGADPAIACRYATATAVEVADVALQLHGGYGYTTEFDVSRAWRDAHAWAVLAGGPPTPGAHGTQGVTA